MQFLMMYISETAEFGVDDVKSAFQSVAGVSEVRENNLVACALECDFSWGEETVIARLAEDRQSVSVDRTGEASRRFALEFQRQYGQPLHLIDEDYTFDEVLTEETTLADVERWLAAEGVG